MANNSETMIYLKGKTASGVEVIQSTYQKDTIDTLIASTTNGKQDLLVSGTNIKTINGESILGDGDLIVEAGTDKQETLVSGVNIKTVGGTSILGEGNITLPTKISDLQNDTSFTTASEIDTIVTTKMADYATSSSVDTKIDEAIDNLVNGAPEALDTLKEIADTLNSKADSASIIASITEKADADDVYTKSEIDTKLENVQTKINFQHLTSGNVNSISTDGEYKIDSAVGLPDGCSTAGWLSVTGITEEYIRQEWRANDIYAFRFGCPDAVATDLTINGVSVTPDANGEIELDDNSIIYTISGVLAGHIKVSKKSTKIILDGVQIISNTESAILYTAGEKSLEITLADGKRNYISVPDTITADTTTAAIFASEVSGKSGNLKFRGTGYLVIKNNAANHGIKAGKVEIFENPHIYVEAGHDAIHASTSLIIENGVFYVSGNDGFGCTNDSDSDAYVKIYGGTYYIGNCAENGFQSKTAGCIEGFSTIVQVSGTSCGSGLVNNISVFETVTAAGVTKLSAEERYGTPTITRHVEYTPSDSSDTTEIPDSDSTIEFTANSVIELTDSCEGSTTVNVGGVDIAADYELEYILHGYFNNNAISIPASVSKVDITLQGAYIETSMDAPAIYYKGSSSRLKVKSDEYIGTDTIEVPNYIVHTATTAASSTDYDCIKSEKNLKITGSGNLFLSSILGDGADGSKFIITGNGIRTICNCGGAALKGSEMYIGMDPDDSPSDSITQSKADDLISDQNMYLFNNSLCGILASNGKRTKGTCKVYGSLVVTVKTLADDGTVESEESKTLFIQSGTVLTDSIGTVGAFTVDTGCNVLYKTQYTETSALLGTITGATLYTEADETYSMTIPDAPRSFSAEWIVLYTNNHTTVTE